MDGCGKSRAGPLVSAVSLANERPARAGEISASAAHQSNRSFDIIMTGTHIFF